MRTDPADLARLAFAPNGSGDRIALGDLVLPRAAMDLRHRRIGPVALTSSAHHRANWLNLLLPYCPETLEELVARCPDCGPLGWIHTRGIDRCESCGNVVPPAKGSYLKPDLAEHYRLAADLMARDAATAASATARLPDAISAFPRTALVSVMVRAGAVLGPERAGSRHGHFVRGDAATTVAALCAGARLLAGWPKTIREEVDARTAAIKTDLPAYEALLDDLRWIGRDVHAGGAALLTMAFPVLDGRTARTLAGEERFYVAAEVNNLLWTSSQELKVLRNAKAIDCEALPSKIRVRGRYRADDVDALRQDLGDSMSPGAAAVELDAPVYAIGQLVARGRLMQPGHRGVRVLRGPQVSAGSVRVLKAAIAAAGPIPPDDARTANFIPLRTALAGVPGEKPWAEAIEEILAGHVAFSIANGASAAIGLRGLLVDAAAASLAPAAALGDDPLDIEVISLRDAAEMLTTGASELAETLASAGVPVVRSGMGKGVERARLAEMAAEIAFTGEVAARSLTGSVATFHELSRIGVARRHGAWCRIDLASRGLAAVAAKTQTVARGSSARSQ